MINSSTPNSFDKMMYLSILNFLLKLNICQMLAIMFHTKQSTYTCRFSKQILVAYFNERFNGINFSEKPFKQNPKLKVKQNFQFHQQNHAS